MNASRLLFYTSLSLNIFLMACSHIVPAQARKMPIIKVLHKGNVESVALEKYVASVLAGEVHKSWPLETLKAQAIAARTFALLRMKERQNNAYHLQNSVMDQVFKKRPDEIFIKAARESAGLVLTLGNHLAETSFHSTCGGKTTDSQSVWGRSYPHLHGGECGYCKTSPTYTWHAEIEKSELENKYFKGIKSINVITRSSDGRAQIIELLGNKRQTISGHEFRMTLGPMKIKSTLVHEIKINGSKVLINGQGFGHGVGMCQYGAMGMAKAGKKFQEILAHYYPGTNIKRLY